MVQSIHYSYIKLFAALFFADFDGLDKFRTLCGKLFIYFRFSAISMIGHLCQIIFEVARRA